MAFLGGSTDGTGAPPRHCWSVTVVPPSLDVGGGAVGVLLSVLAVGPVGPVGPVGSVERFSVALLLSAASVPVSSSSERSR